MAWFLKYAAADKTLEAWGISGLSIATANLAPDQASFTVAGALLDDAELFPYDAEIVISKTDDANPLAPAVVWFRGLVSQTPRMASGTAESHNYVVSGGLYHLERLVFQQEFKFLNQTTKLLELRLVPDLILGQDVAGARQNNGDIVREVLQYAIDSGVALQIGTIDPAVEIPFDEVSTATCLEVLRKVLRWSPDAVVYVDYATSPPTVHCRKRANLPAVVANVPATAGESAVRVSPRNDLQVPAVYIYYRRTVEIELASADPNEDDVPSIFTDTAIDKFPPSATGREPGAVVMIIELAGAVHRHATQTIVVEPFPVDPNDKAWWKSKINDLADVDDADLSITIGARLQPGDNELVEGTIQDWMPVQSWADTITARAAITLRNPDTSVRQIEHRDLTYNCTSTDALEGSGKTIKKYRSASSHDPGEPLPVGVAQAYYNAANPLQYEGHVEIVQAEPSGVFALGTALNVAAAGQPSWATMRALVQSVIVNVDTGSTRVRFGPAHHLGPADLVELLRPVRTRTPAGKFLSRTTGEQVPESENIDLSGPVAAPDSTTAVHEYQRLTVRQPSGPERKIEVNPSALVAGQADMTPRLVTNPRGRGRYLMATDMAPASDIPYYSGFDLVNVSGPNFEIQDHSLALIPAHGPSASEIDDAAVYVRGARKNGPFAVVGLVDDTAINGVWKGTTTVDCCIWLEVEPDEGSPHLSPVRIVKGPIFATAIANTEIHPLWFIKADGVKIVAATDYRSSVVVPLIPDLYSGP